jgi:hypothetical protein
MPRARLPVSLAHLRSYEVALTRTTEEELWEHFTTMFETFDEKTEKWDTAAYTMMMMFMKENPYKNKSFRNIQSSRSRMNNELQWLSDDEETIKEYFKYVLLDRDLMRCDAVFKWSESEDKKELFHDFVHRCEVFRNSINSSNDDIRVLEAKRWNTAYEEWKERDKEWIAAQHLYEQHKTHKSKDYWLNLAARDPSVLAFHDGKLPDNEDTCSLCKHEALVEAMRKQDEEREYELVRKEKEEWAAHEAEERAEAEEQRKAAVAEEASKEYSCDDCSFITKRAAEYRDHIASKGHETVVKLKALYCVCCKTQCVSQSSFEVHNRSSKHARNASGSDDEEKQLHRCECCNYETPFKHVLQNHLKTKRHSERLVAVSAVVPTIVL